MKLHRRNFHHQAKVLSSHSHLFAGPSRSLAELCCKESRPALIQHIGFRVVEQIHFAGKSKL
jgi:hypothetical protein